MRALMPVTWPPPPVTYRAAHGVIGAAGIFPSPGGPTCHDDHCCVLVATTFLLRANSIFDSRPRCGGANLETRGGRCNSNARIRYPILSLTLHVQRLPQLDS